MVSDAVLSALITGAVTLAGTVITVLAANRKTSTDIRVNQAVTDTKIEQLTREVRMHNDFARRIPVLQEQIKVANHRIDDLEHEKT